jgi:MFS family permease
VPVVVGSVGRIPVGALTDRFGGRVMFPLVSVITIVPVLFLGLTGHSPLAALLVGGFFLGVGGTAISALTTVNLVKSSSVETPFVVTAVVLAVYAVVRAPRRAGPAGALRVGRPAAHGDVAPGGHLTGGGVVRGGVLRDERKRVSSQVSAHWSVRYLRVLNKLPNLCSYYNRTDVILVDDLVGEVRRPP